MEQTKTSFINANTLELHYWFNDKSHTMDAVIQNKCEYEFLAIVKEVAASFNVEIVIETEPLENGGQKRRFKINSKNKNTVSAVKIALITALLAALLVTPVTTTISKLTEKMIELILEDKELKELKKEKLILEIEKLKKDVQADSNLLNKEKIHRHRSTFYEGLEKYEKVNQFSVIIEDDNKRVVVEEKKVLRSDFKEFIILDDYIDNETVENVVIEIISPVLKKGKYKWRGIYEGKVINFSVKSNNFRKLVQDGSIEFKNGSSIKCTLEIERKLDISGEVEPSKYNIIDVQEIFENDNPIDAVDWKKLQRQREMEKQQVTVLEFENTEKTRK